MSALAVMPGALLVGERFAGPPGIGNGGYSRASSTVRPR
jgi:hypothetical protein